MALDFAAIQLVASGRDLSSLKVVDRNRAGQLVASGLGPSPLSSGFPRVSPAAAPGRHEVRAGARLQPKLSKLPPGAGYRLCSAFDVTELPPWMTSSNSPCLGCRNLLSRLLRSSWVETGSSADSLHVRKAGSSAGSSHRPQVQKGGGIRLLLTSSVRGRFITPGPKGGGIRLPSHHPRSKRRRHQATPHFFSRGHQPTPCTCERRGHPPAPHIDPRSKKAEASGCSSLLQSEADSSPQVQKAEASGYRVITPGPKGGGIRLPLTSSVRGRVIRRLLTSSISSGAKAPVLCLAADP